ncbi:MAG: SWIM zinc finger family protein [Geodermatophilaceae bacterium]
MSPESTLRVSDAGLLLDLLTGPAMTPQGLVPGARFFSGFVDRSDITACGLLAVADVAGSRYADPGLAQRLATMDPVVTAGGDRLRFESFSLCNGVHARFDLLRHGLGSSEVGFGTTNVDVNQPLRTALARIDRTDPLHLAVGADELQVSSLAASYLEPRVTLPDRWVRGLAETSQLLSQMEPVASLEGAETRRFSAGLPRVAVPGPELHVLPMRGGWRTTTRPVTGSVPLPGATRLRGSDRILRFTEQLTVHRHKHGSTAWVFTVPGGRLTLALSPGPYRGFSGEGTLLSLLTHPEAEQTGRRILTELGWASVIDPSAHAVASNLQKAEVRAGLGWLSASGRLGYDLNERAWFHRELPVDSEAVQRRNPRLVSAQKLLDTDSVAVGSAPGQWRVRGSRGATYTVSSKPDCTCRWETEHNGNRGPCKHVLAVLLMLRS